MVVNEEANAFLQQKNKQQQSIESERHIEGCFCLLFPTQSKVTDYNYTLTTVSITCYEEKHSPSPNMVNVVIVVVIVLLLFLLLLLLFLFSFLLY